MEDTSRELTVSAVLYSFFPEGGKPVSEAEKIHFKVPTQWQKLATLAQFAEVHGSLAGMPHGYMAELLGRAAAAGEQLGLALTAVRDAEVWHDIEPEQGKENMRVIAGRALAESSGLWSVSTGHAVTNVVARVVWAHKLSTHLDEAFKWVWPPEPFAETRQSNLSLNASTVKALVKAAAATEELPLNALVHPLVELIRSPAWVALTSRRDVGYHRWRPQSIDGGALTTNPWVDEGTNSLSLSVGLSSGHVPPTIESLVAESRAGHDALSSAMGDIFNRLPAAMTSAGIGIWKADDEAAEQQSDA
ncbi:hypothetical protein [Cryobacterium sp. Sr3]|uniref:hypothetical protein n=1 Tax=Cryobacterium sp. Sr3 TaxID=1259194 RepID=UPI0010691AD8|nr:hypothetical protein [Cryobacterium sp. Sr3]TFB53434.1 hypothetical protein E3N94_14705 [Cryobacterium sp. Sr3]